MAADALKGDPDVLAHLLWAGVHGRGGVCDLLFSLYFTKLTFQHGFDQFFELASHDETSAW